MSLEQLVAMADKAGLPQWAQLALVIICGGSVAWFTVYRFLRSTPDADRKVLSADEQEFRRFTVELNKELARQLKAADRRITDLTNQFGKAINELGECQRKQALCEGENAGLRAEIEMVRTQLARLTRDT